MTTTATETDLIPVGTRVRVTELWSAGAGAIVNDTGTVESHDPACCDGGHKYRVRIDRTGSLVSVKEVVPVDAETPLAVGDRVRLVNYNGGGYARSGDEGTVTDLGGATMIFVQVDGRQGGARGNGEYAVQRDQFVKIEDGSQPSEPVDTDVQAKIDAAVTEALADYKERVKSVAMDYARRNDWCGEVTRALEDMDIDMTPESERVRVTLDITYEPSSGEAEDGIDYAYLAQQAIRRYVGDYMDGNVTVNDTSTELVDA